MSAETFEVIAQRRADKGKGASRRLRRNGHVPGVVYGGQGEAVAIQLDHSELQMHLGHEAFYSHILALKLDGTTEQVILKDLQRHPFKLRVIEHVDFQRIEAGKPIHVHVPIHFVGEDEAPGRREGGVITHHLTDVTVECLPRDLPEYLEIDVSGLAIGDSLHLSDVKLPQGVHILDLLHDPEADQVLVSIVPPRLAEEAEEGEAAVPEKAALEETEDEPGDDEANEEED